MHIFLTIPSLAKQSGGPATVVQHLSEHLVATGATVTVLTGAAEPGQAQVLPRDARVKVVSISAHRAGARNRAWQAMETDLVAAERHIIHDFGMWLPANHAVVSASQRLGIPLAISPCGMLSPWALQHKAWKKRLAWWLYQRRDLSRAALLVATAHQEQQDIRRWFPKKPIALVPNGVELAEIRSPLSVVRGLSRTVVFLGRIHPVKGLKNLVEAWSRLKPTGWQCILAGPDEGGFQVELQAMLRDHGLHDVFQFPGLMDGEAKWNLLRQADVFVLPSFTENFGIAAAEALACGVPVITTKGTPWNGLVEHRCGWWVDIGVEPLVVAMREAMALSDSARHEMGQRGRRLVEEKYSWPQIASEMLAVYQWLAGNTSKPNCVL